MISEVKVHLVSFILTLFASCASLIGRQRHRNYARDVGKGGKFCGRQGSRAFSSVNIEGGKHFYMGFLRRLRLRFHYSVFKCLRFHITPFSDDLEPFPLLRFRQERQVRKRGCFHYSVFVRFHFLCSHSF